MATIRLHVRFIVSPTKHARSGQIDRPTRSTSQYCTIPSNCGGNNAQSCGFICVIMQCTRRSLSISTAGFLANVANAALSCESFLQQADALSLGQHPVGNPLTSQYCQWGLICTNALTTVLASCAKYGSKSQNACMGRHSNIVYQRKPPTWLQQIEVAVVEGTTRVLPALCLNLLLFKGGEFNEPSKYLRSLQMLNIEPAGEPHSFAAKTDGDKYRSIHARLSHHST